ncbi:MAG: aminotransferase class I/II-fold pyridoxal phosphate-dependent enzyme [Verrucomicrobiales bacterium]
MTSFGNQNRIAITDPVYPVYVDTNVMAGNTGEADANGAFCRTPLSALCPENGFVPAIPKEKVDLSTFAIRTIPPAPPPPRPNSRSGSITLSRTTPPSSTTPPTRPTSRIRNCPAAFPKFPARRCHEFRSFSKIAGFTGVRCAYIIIPKELEGRTTGGTRQLVHPLWSRRHSTKFNGASYPVQRGAAAIFTPQGEAEVTELIRHYMGNAALLRAACADVGLAVYGGENAPYVWVACPAGTDSWGMFDRMLTEANVVITPGSGFGAAGEGYFRISAFNSRANVEEVCRRIRQLLG